MLPDRNLYPNLACLLNRTYFLHKLLFYLGTNFNPRDVSNFFFRYNLQKSEILNDDPNVDEFVL